MNHRALDFASTTWPDGSLPPEREQAVDLTEVSYTRESLGDSRDPNDGQQTLFRILIDDWGKLRWEEWSSDASGITGLQEGHLTQWESIALEHLTIFWENAAGRDPEIVPTEFDTPANKGRLVDIIYSDGTAVRPVGNYAQSEPPAYPDEYQGNLIVSQVLEGYLRHLDSKYGEELLV
jgi:hypothetical protein